MAQVDRSLKSYEEILGVGYLHYGLWEPDDPLTLDGVKIAQERYADFLCSWIPEGVETILDSGCGTGGNALKLKGLGYEVEGLSPDSYQQERFAERTGGLPFHLTKLEDFDPPHTYDLVLMSESAQYVELPELFPCVRRAAPGGYHLVSDYFPFEKTGHRLDRSGHQLDAFLASAKAEGFELLRREDITDRVLPSLDYARQLVDTWGLPLFHAAVGSFEKDHPWLFRLGRWVLRKRIAKIQDQEVLIDSAEFKRRKSYEVFLFRVPE